MNEILRQEKSYSNVVLAGVATMIVKRLGYNDPLIRDGSFNLGGGVNG